MKRTIYAALALGILIGGCAAKDAESAATFKGADMSTASPGAAGETRAGAAVAPGEAPASAAAAQNIAVKVQRAVIRNGTMTVRVDNVEKAEKKANAVVARVGGFVADSQSNDLSSLDATITIKARVPTAAFEPVMSEFEALGTRLAKSTKAEDVTGQILDYDARLKTMRAQEDVYRGMLKQSRRLDDAITLQQKLMELRETIESTAAQLKGLSDLASLSTIELTLSQSLQSAPQRPEDKNWAGEAWAKAAGSGISFLKSLMVVAMWMVIYSPLILLAWLALRWLVKAAKPKPKPEPPPQIET